MSIEDQISEIQKSFPNTQITSEKEGGCLFIKLPSFFSDSSGPIDCIFQCSPHLGYDTRLWFSRTFKTSVDRHWNNQNTYILGQTWNAFSYKVQGNTLLEKLLAHLKGAK